jgi:hypothetical protein
MGYHLRPIATRGVYGEPSKIREELEELEESLEQNNRILALVELSDLYGALKGVAEKLGSNMTEVAAMAAATERAFLDGTRKAREVVPVLPEATPSIILEAQYTVYWDPPINKGTRFQRFNAREHAEAFAETLRNTGWPMNIRIVEPGQPAPADVNPLLFEFEEKAP